MRSPVARVPDERQLLPALPALEQERATRDRPSCPRIVDRVLPEALEVAARKRMTRQDRAEEEAPVWIGALQQRR